MGRKRKEWDPDYMDMLRRVPGSGSLEARRPVQYTSTQGDFSEVREWRYLMKHTWTADGLSQNNKQPVDWDSVERIIVDHDISDIDRCPICLTSPPDNARMAKCGHIFCLTCIYKYQQFFGTQCPLCKSHLYIFKPLLYSATAEKPIKLGEKLQFSLFYRSINGHAIVKHGSQCVDIPPINHPGLAASSYVRASKSHLVRLLNTELRRLSELCEEEDKEIYDRAMADVKSELSKIESQVDCETVPKSEIPYYFFYQPRNRTRTYLNPLDVKVLLAEFGDYQSFPAEIEAEVKLIEYMKVDSMLLSRFRYLNYLSPGTIVRMISCDWQPLVSKEVFERFSSDLKEKHILPEELPQPEPFHPEQMEEAEVNYEEATEEEYEEEESEYLYDRARSQTFGDYLPGTISTTVRNGRRVFTIHNNGRKYRS